MSALSAAGTAKVGAFTADVELQCDPGEVVALLGPNGAGKSTVLRTIAGLTPLTSGNLRINDAVVDDAAATFVPAEQRRIGMVFQDYVLFGHMSVRENIAFSPRARDVDAWIERLDLSAVADRTPGKISGGQAQRCALARALVTDPDVLLLDEPLAALDAGTKMAVRSELRGHLAGASFGSVLVTHDPLDAMVLADRIVVMERGSITQQGTSLEVASTPRTEYVASLMGVTMLRGTARDGVFTCTDGGTLISADTAVRGNAIALVRPESIALHRAHPEGSPRNVFRTRVTELSTTVDRVRVALAGPPALVATVTQSAVAELGLLVGAEVWASLKATEVQLHAS